MANKENTVALPEEALSLWATNVSSNENYLNADPTAKDAVADDFFLKHVAPNIPQNELDHAHQVWIMATSDPKEYYTSPSFLNLDKDQRRSVLRDNLIARGMSPDEQSSEKVANINQAKSGAAPEYNTAVDDEYMKFVSDPAVSALRQEAWGKSVGAPFAGISQTRASITGEEDLAKDSAEYVGRKNQLQQWFPESEIGEYGTEAALLAVPATKLAKATELGEGATIAAKAGKAAINTAGNAAVATTINPETGETPKELRSDKAGTFAENVIFQTAMHSLEPATRGIKNLFGGAVDSATGLYNRIVDSATKVSKATGKSKEEVLQSVVDDLVKANPKEQTAAGIAGVKSSTSTNSGVVINDINNPASGAKVNADVRTNEINTQAQSAIEKAGTRVATQKGANAPILKAKDLPEGTTLEEAQAKLAPKKLAQSGNAFATSDPMARNTPVGQASEVAAAVDQAILPNSKLPANDPVSKKALENSPTIQAIREAGGESTPPLTAEYQATVKQLGQETADNLVKSGQIKQFTKSAVTDKPMSAETLQDHIDSLELEIKDATGKQKAALMGVKNKLIEVQDTVYKANPGLKEAVTKSINMAKTDRSLEWFEDATTMLDKDNSMDFTGKMKQNFKIDTAKGFLQKYGTDEAAADRARLMAHDPELLKASDDLVEAVRQWTRQNDTTIKGAVVEGGEKSAGKAAIHAGIQAKTTAVTNAISAVNKTINKRYADALEDFAKDNPKAHDAINAAIKKLGKKADMRKLYQTIARPVINVGAGMGANAIADKGQTPQIDNGQQNLSPYLLPK